MLHDHPSWGGKTCIINMVHWQNNVLTIHEKFIIKHENYHNKSVDCKNKV